MANEFWWFVKTLADAKVKDEDIDISRVRIDGEEWVSFNKTNKTARTMATEDSAEHNALLALQKILRNK